MHRHRFKPSLSSIPEEKKIEYNTLREHHNNLHTIMKTIDNLIKEHKETSKLIDMYLDKDDIIGALSVKSFSQIDNQKIDTDKMQECVLERNIMTELNQEMCQS